MNILKTILTAALIATMSTGATAQLIAPGESMSVGPGYGDPYPGDTDSSFTPYFDVEELKIDRRLNAVRAGLFAYVMAYCEVAPQKMLNRVAESRYYSAYVDTEPFVQGWRIANEILRETGDITEFCIDFSKQLDLIPVSFLGCVEDLKGAQWFRYEPICE